ncbi:hypothetical protein SK803_44065 [Lentzea sp. BCCO 10_0856]|uniref:Uncharacterized protein n=1 Tax=Lentzea miocenica TaxID=3095431 RepID=A0ABU4TH73_9PSEU|nr:hypothetical protein [Lentzea sp. BCCO 10_0856]MDX8037212.1 hypothetical protein [Lentzea sp. BCCO 10_0856]
MPPEPECELCDGKGTMTWQQPMAGPDGQWALSQVDHPCVNGCSGWWQLPAAEHGGILDRDTGINAGGNVAQANEQVRTDWSMPPRLRRGPLTEPPAR